MRAFSVTLESIVAATLRAPARKHSLHATTEVYP